MEKIKPMSIGRKTIGELPSSYLVSMTYEEQLIWLCEKMKEIINFMNGEIDEELQKYINEQFNNIMLQTMYNAEEEKIIFYLDEVGEENE